MEPLLRVHMMLSLMVAISYSNADFSEYPSNITLMIGSEMEAVFRCHHLIADTIVWRVNGTSVKQNPSPDITPGTTRDDDGTLVDTLTIIARPEYNGTEVQCVAVFLGGSQTEATPSVILTIIDGEKILTTTTSIVPTTTVMDQETTYTDPTTTSTQSPTTLPPSTMPPPPTDSIKDLMSTTDSTSGRFLLSPMSLNLTVDAVAMFQCQHSTADGINWKINGATLRDFPEGISTDRNGEIFSLTIIALPEYNQTAIECVALFSNSPSEGTDSAILMIQGRLDSVTEVHRNSSTLSWIPPPSLDLTGVDPDIVYCVEVYNITCEVDDLVVGDCNVTEPSYTSDDIAPDGYIYEYTVTPRSNVEGASNGTSLTVTEQFTVLNRSSMGHSVSMMKGIERDNRRGGDKNVLTRAEIHLDVHPVQEAIRPAEYSISRNSLDGVQTHNHRLEADVSMRTKSSIMLEVAPLPFRRLWNMIVFAHTCDGHPLTEEMEIGTHDFHNISIISPPKSGVIMVTGDVINGSSSIGILIIAYLLTDDSSAHYHFIEHTDVQQPRMYPVVMGLIENQYEVVIFVMEENGIPFHRATATPKTIQIDGATEVLPPPIVYELHPTSTGVCITCTFLDSSTTDCVAVVHQRISQLSSSGLMNIESSHKFNRSGGTAFGCIPKVNLTAKMVGVIGGRQVASMTSKSQSSQCTPWCIVGPLVAVILGLVSVTLAVIVYMYVTRRRPKNRPPHEAAIVPPVSLQLSQSENQYETIQQRIQSDGGGGTLLEAGATITSTALELAPITDPPTTSDTSGHTPIPFTLEHLLPELLPLAAKWLSLGEALSLDEDHLDEVYTNNETDEACLQEMLEVYMARSDFSHSWEEIQEALKKIREESVINQPEVTPGKDQQENTKSPSENGDTPESPEQSPQDDGHSPVQQTRSEDQLRHVDEDDHQSDFDKQATESKQSTSKDGGRFESGKDATIASETAPVTGDNRSGDGINKSEESQSTSCTPIPFDTGYEGPTVDQGMSCAEDQCDIGSLKYQNTDNIQVSKGNITRHHCHKFKATRTLLITDTSGHTPIPFTLESLLRKLLPLASKWLSLGKALSLDEDRLDEIFTNNETDEARLQEMLEVYMVGSDFNHSWEEVQEALKNIGEESVINQPKVTPDKILTEYQDPQDEESPKPQHENEDTPYSPHYEPPPDDGYSLSDPVQQSMNEDQEEPVNRDDYESNYEEQATQSNESTKKEGTSQFENGRRATANSGPMTNDNDSRKIYVMKETEEYQRTTCIPIVFNTVYEGSTVDHNQESGQVKAPSSEVLLEIVSSQTTGVSSADELVICHNWPLLKKHNTVMPRTVHLKEA